MVKSTRFENGLTLVTETFGGVRSVSVGFWVGAGSGFENERNNGISHFTEHVMFKGTEKYSAYDIARLFEDYGANFNAFTAKEATCYYFKCIDEKLNDCFELLSHIFYESTFAEEELDKERKVIVEEINMVEDEPEDICYDKLAERVYAGTGLARTILGPIENVLSFKRKDVLEYMEKMYTPDNTVISMVGNITHEQAIALLEKYVLPKCGNGKCRKTFSPNVQGNGFVTYKKDFEQVNLAYAFPSISFDDERKEVQAILSFCLGVGMSSRLFQVLREQKGLVYNVYTSNSTYKNNGVFGIYVNTSGKNLFAAADAVRDELSKLQKHGLCDEEINRAKTQLRSNLLFSLENMSSVMNANGKYTLYTGRDFDLDKQISEIDRVKSTDVSAFINEIIRTEKATVAYVGKESFLGDENLYDKFAK